MKLKVYTLGKSNGDGSATIKCFASLVEREEYIMKDAKGRKITEEEIEDNMFAHELGYKDETEIEFDGKTFKPFYIYVDGV